MQGDILEFENIKEEKMSKKTPKPKGPLTYGKTKEESALYQEITRRLCDEEDPAHDLAMMFVFNPKQARVFLAFPPATVVPIEEIAKKTGFSKEFVEKTCKELYIKGYMVSTRRGWAPVRSAVQAFDTGPTPKAAKMLGDGYYQLMRMARGGGTMAEAGSAMGGTEMELMTGLEYPMFKIFPHIKALNISGYKDEDILPIEDYREDFKNASSIAVNYCGCRRHSWGAKEYPQGFVCICFDRGAEYQVKRGSAKMLTPGQMLEIEENVCIPEWDMYTASNMLKQDYVCNCSYTVPCIFERPMEAGQLKDAMTPSRYQAVIDPDECNACGQCVKKCKVKAASMKEYPMETEHAWVNPDTCLGCGCCVVNCPTNAIKLICVRPPNFIVQRDSMPTGRYDTPETYHEMAKRMDSLRAKRRKRDKKLEEEYCAEHGIDRNPHRIQP